MARVLVLGAGECQLNLIRRLVDEGHEVHVSDYLENSPGKRLDVIKHLASTFDAQANLAIVRENGIEAILTAGTDQPVRTIGEINEMLGRSGFISRNQSLAMTNKRIMKSLFSKNGIPTVDYRLLSQSDNPGELEICFPSVIKPVDSQGQRGIYLVDDLASLEKYLPDTFLHTREDRILLESYYPGSEVTVTGWVEKGSLHILSITDREAFESGPQ